MHMCWAARAAEAVAGAVGPALNRSEMPSSAPEFRSTSCCSSCRHTSRAKDEIFRSLLIECEAVNTHGRAGGPRPSLLPTLDRSRLAPYSLLVDTCSAFCCEAVVPNWPNCLVALSHQQVPQLVHSTPATFPMLLCNPFHGGNDASEGSTMHSTLPLLRMNWVVHREPPSCHSAPLPPCSYVNHYL